MTAIQRWSLIRSRVFWLLPLPLVAALSGARTAEDRDSRCLNYQKG